MTGTTYQTNRWTPPYRVCDRCEENEPVGSDASRTPLPGTATPGEIAACDRPDHFSLRERDPRADDEATVRSDERPASA